MSTLIHSTNIDQVGANIIYQIVVETTPCGACVPVELGEGRFAKVFKAWQRSDGQDIRQVAMKVLHNTATYSHQDLFDRPDPRRLDLRASLRDPEQRPGHRLGHRSSVRGDLESQLEPGALADLGVVGLERGREPEVFQQRRAQVAGDAALHAHRGIEVVGERRQLRRDRRILATQPPLQPGEVHLGRGQQRTGHRRPFAAAGHGIAASQPCAFL